MSTQLRLPYSEFTAFQHNHADEDNALHTQFGVAVTPGASNVMGSWTSLLGTTVANDSYGVLITIHRGEAAGQNNSRLVDIGIDYDGGTSYSVLIPTLNGCAANDADTGPGHTYYFPLHIPANSTLAARAQQNNASPTDVRMSILLMQKPTRPELIWYGSAVETLGADTANSRGTVINAGFSVGDSSDFTGATWVQIGSASAHPSFYWTPSFGVDDSTMTAGVYWMSFGVGVDTSTVRTLADRWYYGVGSNEDIGHVPLPAALLWQNMPEASEFYCKPLFQSSTPDSNVNVMVHLVR